jgi:hypothetical protein
MVDELHIHELHIYEIEQRTYDELHILIWNRTKKPLVIALSGAGGELRGRDDGGDLTNVPYKPNQNCNYESPS